MRYNINKRQLGAAKMKTQAERVKETNTINELMLRLEHHGDDFEQDYLLGITIEHFEDGSKLIYEECEVRTSK